MNAYSNQNKIKEDAMHHLTTLFGEVLEFNVIKSVANNCSYNVDTAITMLSEISQNLEDSAFQVVEKKKKKHDEAGDISPDEIELRYQRELNIERIVQFIKEGWRVMVLLRGLPGSGKSHLASEILAQSLGQVNRKDFILSTDDYFTKTGTYIFNPSELQNAHSWNQRRCFSSMRRGYSPLLIDNTNLEVWQMKPYCLMAAEFGYCIEIVEPANWWAMNPRMLEEKNVHGIHKAKIMEMLTRYEQNVSSDVLARICNLKYQHILPQYRRYPPLEKSSPEDTTNFQNSDDFWRVQSKPSPDAPLEYVENYSLDTGKITAKNVEDLLTTKNDKYPNIMQPLLKFSENTSKSYLAKPLVQNLDTFMKSKNSDRRTESAIFSPSLLRTGDAVSMVGQLPLKANVSNQTIDLEAWGLTEKALVSWDVVLPVQEHQKKENVSLQEVHKRPVQSELSEKGTNTCTDDFKMVMNTTQSDLMSDVKVLTCRNRDISSGIISQPLSPQKKIVVDQSCMTNQEALMDTFKGEKDYSEDILKLCSLFPTVPGELLSEIYEKCHKDLNWTVDLLMDNDGLEILSHISVNKGDKVMPIIESSHKEEIAEDLINFEVNSITEDSEKIDMEDRKHLDIIRLKKCIEENVSINKEHYSNHVWQLKTIKRSQTSSSEEGAGKTSFSRDDSPLPDPSSKFSSTKESPLVMEDILNDEAVYYSDEETEIDRLVEINLGVDLAKCLGDMFGNIDCDVFKPIVQVPESLAKQLHALLLESVSRQIDNRINLFKETLAQDEAYAMLLQEAEREKTTGLNEIMDEELAKNLYMKDVDQWKNLSPDDLASKLTRQKLFKMFPNINKDDLVQILQAHNNCYKLTVTTLLDSTDQPLDCELLKPPITENTLEEMKEAQKTITNNDDNEERSAMSYREEANYYMQKHSSILNLMHQYRQRGMHEVAIFYSNVARKQMQLAECANQRASYAFIQENASRQKDSSTLDLHYLFVKEAISSLDIFLDHHISRLAKKNGASEYLYIVTGRGKRSEDGKSKLKPAVMKRLNKRKIQFHQVNPGLLRIKVQKNLLMSTDL